MNGPMDVTAANLELAAAYAEFPAPGTAMKADVEVAAERVNAALHARAAALASEGGAA